MQGTRILIAMIMLAVASIFSMNQQTPAQQRRQNARATPTPARVTPPEVSYTVSMSKPATHLLEVEMRVAWQAMPAQLELKMPVWTPGSYLVREYARHVQDVSAKNTAGSALEWRKISKNTWQIDTGGTKEVRVSYRVYSNELTVRTNELNDEHAFWNNTALLLYIKDHLHIPSTVRVVPFGDWKVATGLPPVSGAENTFRADNYDILYDSPFEVSNFREFPFEVRGKPHRYVVTGEGNYDLARLAADTAKIAEECYKIFGELPYENYTFIVNTRGSGGLEHLNSTALQVGRFNFRPDSRYKQFLELVTHELFHAWNVKRIRPDALGPFDYENENYTRLLWVAEGTTSYYEGVIMRRAGLISESEFWSNKSSIIQQLQARPGRFETSLEQASFDAWIKYYRPDENSPNNQISYYDKGDVVSMLLDITIRTSSDGKRSLDDVLRHLYAEFFKKGRNFTPADFQKAAEMMAATSLEDFFRKYVRGTAELDYAGIMAPLGVAVRVRDVASSRAYNGTDAADGSLTIRSIPSMGIDLAEEGGKLSVRTVLAGSPAYEFGLNTGDQVLAVDGYRTNQAFMQRYMGERKAGETVKLTVFRFDKLRDISITVGQNTRTEYLFGQVDDPTETQSRLYRQYLNVQP
jgi:predicted metalloprotease with PDZ domain